MRAIVIGAIVAAGCGAGEDLFDREDFTEALRIPREEQADALRPQEEPETFTYRARGRRSPFDPASGWAAGHPGGSAAAAPDLERSRQYLERYPVDRITMVGTLARGTVRFGLVQAEGGPVYRVGVGDYLGEHRGRVQEIEPLAMELLETVPNGAGARVERSRIISLGRPTPEDAENRER